MPDMSAASCADNIQLEPEARLRQRLDHMAATAALFYSAGVCLRQTNQQLHYAAALCDF